jgi:hypothetical protein
LKKKEEEEKINATKFKVPRKKRINWEGIS